MDPFPGIRGTTVRWRTILVRTGGVLMLMVLVVLLGGWIQREPEKDTTAIIEASYIYNIAKLVQWEDPAMRKGSFVIGVMGSNNLYQELVKKYASRTIGQQPIEVRKLPEMAEVDRCHMLFVPAANSHLLSSILKQPNVRTTLIVTDYPGALAQGAVVNFIAARNTLKYEISLPNARRQQIEIGLTLRQLADNVVE